MNRQRRLPGRGWAALIVLAVTCCAALPGTTLAQSPQVNHGAFDVLLAQHVRGGLVNYDAFASAPEFTRYLAMLAATDPASLPRAAQLAFWINAYNAYTIAQVNAHNERRSIKNINRALGFLKTGGAWSEPMATVGGTRYTLDDIEHKVIRPRFNEPRVHFALVCAALGCPPLRSEAYVAARLEQQLEDQARVFLVASPAKNSVEVAQRRVNLSPIFKWYGDDFAPSSRELQQWIARYWPQGAERALLESGNARVRWTEYDWSLNVLPAR